MSRTTILLQLIFDEDDDIGPETHHPRAVLNAYGPPFSLGIILIGSKARGQLLPIMIPNDMS